MQSGLLLRDVRPPLSRMSRPHPCGAFGVVAPVCLMSPVLVRLPRRALGRRDWLLATIERQASSCAWAFQLAPDELQFARALAARSTNLWIFRSHQQAACADFVGYLESAPPRLVLGSPK